MDEPTPYYRSAILNGELSIAETVEQVIRASAYRGVSPYDLMDLILDVTSSPARCMWITGQGRLCRCEGIQYFNSHPAIPEDTLRLCAHDILQLTDTCEPVRPRASSATAAASPRATVEP